MRKKLEKFCSGLFVVAILMVVALMINYYFWVNAQKKKVTTVTTVQVTQPENGWGEVPMTTEVVVAVEKTAVVTNAPNGDGSVVVNDKGASFVMMPASNRQPVFVPENLLRKK